MASMEDKQGTIPRGENRTAPPVRPIVGGFLCLALLGALYLGAAVFRGQVAAFARRDSFAAWHELFHILALILSLSIWVLFCQIYPLSRRPRHLVMGLAFGCAAALDLLYRFSLGGTPLIWTGEGARESVLWMGARLILAGGMALGALAPDRETRHPVWSGAGTGAGYAAALALVMALYGGRLSLPALTWEIGAFYLTAGLTLLGILLYLHLYLREEEASHLTVALALAVTGMSEVMLSRSGRDELFVLGLVYRLLGYLLFFVGLFLYHIRRPYALLRQREAELKAAVSDLERKVAQRTLDYSQANAKLLKNLEDAKAIQMALLKPNFPRIEALDFAVRYMPCEQVGGDFYRVFRLDDEHVGIFFGDVAGHGVSAAMVNVFISQNVRFKVEYEGGHYRIFTPRGVLMHLYHIYNEMAFPEEIYILLFYGIYNTRSGIMTYSSAGFNMAPLILGQDGTVRTLPMEGFPICHFGEHFKPTYVSRQVQLNPEDVMMIYSDGLIEIDRKRPDLFGPQRVAECAKAYAGEGPDAVCQGLMDAYFALRGKRKILDDVTVLAFRVLGKR